MCTVTFIPRKHGFALGMNRDEQRSRVRGLPPKWQRQTARGFIAPQEPNGGTWIALNDYGVCLALINWYAQPSKGSRKPVSRGTVIPSVIQAGSLEEAASLLAGLNLKHIKPFRLIGVFSGPKINVEWRWDGRQLERHRHGWSRRQWVSSGFDEPEAQRIRGQIFRQALQSKDAGALPWLRRLHGSHWPKPGPFATCMHRADAATVSYTEVVVTRRQSRLCYHDGPLCDVAEWATVVSPKPVE